jgi:hypothetical protein
MPMGEFAMTGRSDCRLPSSLFAAIALLGLLLGEIPAGAEGNPFQLPIQGGKGGGSFEVLCPPGFFMFGFTGKSGVVIDHLRIRCANVEIRDRPPPTHWILFDQFTDGALVGDSTGGSFAEDGCSRDGLMDEIRFTTTFEFKRTHLIAYIRGSCHHPLQGRKPFHFGHHRPIAGEVVQRCPDGMHAIGLRGRRGLFIDAIGLVCRRGPL